MIFSGYEVDKLGNIINTDKSNLDCMKILCEQTTGHKYNIVNKRCNDIEVTFFRNSQCESDFGVEIYYYKPGTWDIKYSRIYRDLDKVPHKYQPWSAYMQTFHKQVFGN